MSDTCSVSERVAISTTHPSRPTTCHLGTVLRSQCECVTMGHQERAMQTYFRLIWAGFGTSRAVLAVGSNVDLDVRPPHMHGASDFMRTIPMCVKCSMLRPLSRSAVGMMTVESHRSTPSFDVITVWAFR